LTSACGHLHALLGTFCANISLTNDTTAMRMAPFDSAPQISLSIFLYDVLTVCRRPASLGYTNTGIGHVSIYISSTRAATVKRTLPLDSPRQIGVNAFWTDVLGIGGATASVDSKKQRNRTRFRLYLHNQGRYGKMDGTVAFSTSNRSNYVLDRSSNCR